MIPIVPEMNINKFVDVRLPSKRELFSRVGANAPGKLYSGDDPVPIGFRPTEQADAFVKVAEAFESPKQEEPKDSE